MCLSRSRVISSFGIIWSCVNPTACFQHNAQKYFSWHITYHTCAINLSNAYESKFLLAKRSFEENRRQSSSHIFWNIWSLSYFLLDWLWRAFERQLSIYEWSGLYQKSFFFQIDKWSSYIIKLCILRSVGPLIKKRTISKI